MGGAGTAFAQRGKQKKNPRSENERKRKREEGWRDEKEERRKNLVVASNQMAIKVDEITTFESSGASRRDPGGDPSRYTPDVILKSVINTTR